jgi:hypothetical protein
MNKFAIVYDVDERRPGCVLLQAALGGTVPPSRFGELFDAADWLLAPTPGMKLYRVTEEQLAYVAAKTKLRDR